MYWNPKKRTGLSGPLSWVLQTGRWTGYLVLVVLRTTEGECVGECCVHRFLCLLRKRPNVVERDKGGLWITNGNRVDHRVCIPRLVPVDVVPGRSVFVATETDGGVGFQSLDLFHRGVIDVRTVLGCTEADTDPQFVLQVGEGERAVKPGSGGGRVIRTEKVDRRKRSHLTLESSELFAEQIVFRRRKTFRR